MPHFPPGRPRRDTHLAVRAAIRAVAIAAVLMSAAVAYRWSSERFVAAWADGSATGRDLDLAARAVQLAGTAAALLLVAGLLLVAVRSIARPDPAAGLGLAVAVDLPVLAASVMARNELVARTLGVTSAVLLACLVAAVAVRARMRAAERERTAVRARVRPARIAP